MSIEKAPESNAAPEEREEEMVSSHWSTWQASRGEVPYNWRCGGWGWEVDLEGGGGGGDTLPRYLRIVVTPTSSSLQKFYSREEGN